MFYIWLYVGYEMEIKMQWIFLSEQHCCDFLMDIVSNACEAYVDVAFYPSQQLKAVLQSGKKLHKEKGGLYLHSEASNPAATSSEEKKLKMCQGIMTKKWSVVMVLPRGSITVVSMWCQARRNWFYQNAIYQVKAEDYRNQR